MGNISKITTKFSGLSVWITSVPLSGSIWIAPLVERIADWNVQEARTEAVRRGDKSSLHIQFDGLYLTRGHYSINSSATVHYAKTGKIIAYSHRTKPGQGANWEGANGGAAWPTMLRHQAAENSLTTSGAAKKDLFS